MPTGSEYRRQLAQQTEQRVQEARRRAREEAAQKPQKESPSTGKHAKK